MAIGPFFFQTLSHSRQQQVINPRPLTNSSHNLDFHGSSSHNLDFHGSSSHHHLLPPPVNQGNPPSFGRQQQNSSWGGNNNNANGGCSVNGASSPNGEGNGTSNGLVSTGSGGNGSGPSLEHLINQLGNLPREQFIAIFRNFLDGHGNGELPNDRGSNGVIPQPNGLPPPPPPIPPPSHLANNQHLPPNANSNNNANNTENWRPNGTVSHGNSKKLFAAPPPINTKIPPPNLVTEVPCVPPPEFLRHMPPPNSHSLHPSVKDDLIVAPWDVIDAHFRLVA